jgi:hypothetical protein
MMAKRSIDPWSFVHRRQTSCFRYASAKTTRGCAGHGKH